MHHAAEFCVSLGPIVLFAFELLYSGSASSTTSDLNSMQKLGMLQKVESVILLNEFRWVNGISIK